MDNGIFCCNIILSMNQSASLLWINVLNESYCLNSCCCQLSLSGDSFSQLWNDFGNGIQIPHHIQCLKKQAFWRSSAMKPKNELAFPPGITKDLRKLSRVVQGWWCPQCPDNIQDSCSFSDCAAQRLLEDY